jgi:hypothetical protein
MVGSQLSNKVMILICALNRRLSMEVHLDRQALLLSKYSKLANAYGDDTSCRLRFSADD